MRAMWGTLTTSDDGGVTITHKQGNLDATKVIKRLNMTSFIYNECTVHGLFAFGSISYV